MSVGCVKQVVGQANVVAAMVAVLPSLPDQAVAAPLTYMSALITALPAKQFAAQFVEAGGASPTNLHRWSTSAHHWMCPMQAAVDGVKSG